MSLKSFCWGFGVLQGNGVLRFSKERGFLRFCNGRGFCKVMGFWGLVWFKASYAVLQFASNILCKLIMKAQVNIQGQDNKVLKLIYRPNLNLCGNRNVYLKTDE